MTQTISVSVTSVTEAELMPTKDIPGYEGLYRINENGQVFKANGQEMKGNINSYGYRVVSLTRDRIKSDCKVHRLVAMTFIPNPNDYDCVNHIDGNKLNNSVSNLEWCSKGHNNRHARYVIDTDYSHKPVVQADANGRIIAVWRSAEMASTITGISSRLIRACCRGTARQAGGFMWEYAREMINDYIKHYRLSIDFDSNY